MTESNGPGTATDLASKVQAFLNTLGQDEASLFQRLAEKTVQHGEVQGFASDQQVTFDLPESLVEKLRAFAATLPPDELSALRVAGQAKRDEVRGYVDRVGAGVTLAVDLAGIAQLGVAIGVSLLFTAPRDSLGLRNRRGHPSADRAAETASIGAPLA